MKNIILFLGLTITTFSISAVNVVEFDEVEEKKCHSELKALKCVDANGKESLKCTEKNKTQLSKNCQDLHSIRMLNL